MNRCSLVRSSRKKRRMVPRKPVFVAKVPVCDEDEVVTTAKVEKLSSGNLIVHIDARELSADILRRGFSFGKMEETDAESVQ